METNELMQRLEKLKPMYFNTPLVRVDVLDEGVPRSFYAKYEAGQMSGSIKDRIAYYIFKEGIESGKITKDTQIVEVSSGNTAIALTALAKAMDIAITIVLPIWLTEERKQLLKLYGANLIFTDGEDAFIKAVEKARALEAEGYFYPDQFSSIANVHAHEYTTAPELFAQLEKVGKRPTHFVAGVGSGGTSAGVNAYLQTSAPDCQSYLLEPKQAPSLRLRKETVPFHLIQGIGDGFIPAVIKIEEHAGIVEVDDYDAAHVAQLINKAGFSVGISSGGNTLGALQLLRENPDAIVTTVFADCAKKYLSTQLAQDFTEVERLSNVQIIKITPID